MNRHSAYLFTIIAFFCIAPLLPAQQLPNPFDFPILLSGSFGELRSNHFHSGVDFKTQGAEGKAIRAVNEGHVSRISVSPGGYGNALYLDHPDGTTTVYAHMLRFTPEIMEYIKEQQYEKERFAITLYPSPDMFRFRKGDIIGLSGNTGSSAGPHLHFEVRDTESEEIIDPIIFYKDQVTDTRPPRIQGIMIYPMEGTGVVNGDTQKREYKQFINQNGVQHISSKIEAWGKIGLGLKAYDYMNNTSNIYGVKEIILSVDDQIVYHSYIDRYAFDESRYINSFTDYEEWINNSSWYMKSFVEPGNRLRFIQTINRGIININEERTYKIHYTLSDAFGNSTQLTFNIEGRQEKIPEPDPDTEKFFWASANRFGAKGVRLYIPRGNLYKDFLFKYDVKEDSTALSAIHHLHDKPLAFHNTGELSIRLQHDTLENKNQYGIVKIHKGRKSWIVGTYRDGWIDATIREMGSYSLDQDTTPPTITPVNQSTWIKNQRFSFRLSDNLSGILNYRGEIDGQYVLFEMNNRSVITYRFDKERLQRGKHTLKLIATDACGNESLFEYPFTW